MMMFPTPFFGIFFIPHPTVAIFTAYFLASIVFLAPAVIPCTADMLRADSHLSRLGYPAIVVALNSRESSPNSHGKFPTRSGTSPLCLLCCIMIPSQLPASNSEFSCWPFLAEHQPLASSNKNVRRVKQAPLCLDYIVSIYPPGSSFLL